MTQRDTIARVSRHAFVLLGDAWRTHLRAPLPAKHEVLVDAWQAQGRPFVVARGQPGDEAGTLRLGLALPDKTRIGLNIATDAVASVQQAPCLADTFAAAPASWVETLAKVQAIAERHDVAIAVYGSLAWQALTGLACVRPGSDVDLLITSVRWTGLERVTMALAALSGAPRLDGEALLPGGAAVAWRELARAPVRLLVKDRASVYLAAYADVRSRFMQAAA